MKAILALATLLFSVITAVSSAALYQNENYILSGVLCIASLASVVLLIKYAGIHVINTEKA
jgi:opacity protein-like surface antigen